MMTAKPFRCLVSGKTPAEMSASQRRVRRVLKSSKKAAFVTPVSETCTENLSAIAAIVKPTEKKVEMSVSVKPANIDEVRKANMDLIQLIIATDGQMSVAELEWNNDKIATKKIEAMVAMYGDIKEAYGHVEYVSVTKIVGLMPEINPLISVGLRSVFVNTYVNHIENMAAKALVKKVFPQRPASGTSIEDAVHRLRAEDKTFRFDQLKMALLEVYPVESIKNSDEPALIVSEEPTVAEVVVTKMVTREDAYHINPEAINTLASGKKLYSCPIVGCEFGDHGLPARKDGNDVVCPSHELLLGKNVKDIGAHMATLAINQRHAKPNKPYVVMDFHGFTFREAVVSELVKGPYEICAICGKQKHKNAWVCIDCISQYGVSSVRALQALVKNEHEPEEVVICREINPEPINLDDYVVIIKSEVAAPAPVVVKQPKAKKNTAKPAIKVQSTVTKDEVVQHVAKVTFAITTREHNLAFSHGLGYHDLQSFKESKVYELESDGTMLAEIKNRPDMNGAEETDITEGILEGMAWYRKSCTKFRALMSMVNDRQSVSTELAPVDNEIGKWAQDFWNEIVLEANPDLRLIDDVQKIDDIKAVFYQGIKFTKGQFFAACFSVLGTPKAPKSSYVPKATEVKVPKKPGKTPEEIRSAKAKKAAADQARTSATKGKGGGKAEQVTKPGSKKAKQIARKAAAKKR